MVEISDLRKMVAEVRHKEAEETTRELLARGVDPFDVLEDGILALIHITLVQVIGGCFRECALDKFDIVYSAIVHNVHLRSQTPDLLPEMQQFIRKCSGIG